MIGQIIRNYQIISKIGEGGMGIVYKAQHITLKRMVAIKVLNQELSQNPEIIQRFYNEAKILSELQHPNIVTLYDYFEESNHKFLIMEYFEGQTLENYIHQIAKAIPETHAILIFEQLLSAFAYAHEKGIIHRDIKPSNILINTKQKVKILDFGIAKITEATSHTKTGVKMGTIMYMSPEQIQASKNIDHRTDIYSLGVVLWEMVTGSHPYDLQTQSEFEISNAIVQEPLPHPKKINPKCSDKIHFIIQKCTAKNPIQRYKNCQEIRIDTMNYYPELFPKSLQPKKLLTQNEITLIEEKPFPWKILILVLVLLAASIGAYFAFFFPTYTENDIKKRIIAFYDKLNHQDISYKEWLEPHLHDEFSLANIPKGTNLVDTSSFVIRKINDGYKVQFKRIFQNEKQKVEKKTTFYLRDNNLNVYHYFSEDIQTTPKENFPLEKEIYTFLQNFYEYADNQDVDKLVNCYDEKVEKWFLENTPVTNDYIRKQAEKYIQTVQNEITDISNVRISPIGNQEFEIRFHMEYSYEFRSKGLKRNKRRGSSNEVLMKIRRKKDSFKIYHLEILKSKNF